MEQYVEAKLDIIEFCTEDVITASGINSDIIPGDNELPPVLYS